MLERWRMARAGEANASTQYTLQLCSVPFRTTMLGVAVCGWEFITEITRTDATGRTVLLILPQLGLLVIIVSQFFCFTRRLHRIVVLSITVLTPAFVIAFAHSGFRMGLGLCCCSRSFCPIMYSADLTPDTEACGLVLNNCYMAFIRKIFHFYGTASLLAPLATAMFTELSNVTHQSSERMHCHAFMSKTRLQ
ncbi:hypothetical protein PRNP1_008081 [Phytophthora ramorum]|uniref:uncharacterized protein n=1 Tax=Phytophthora ramorum TaxID=164328 RepID=UPI0030A6E094|nr:hypothetical protein KRP23_6834 [Phytophthora ramorum]